MVQIANATLANIRANRQDRRAQEMQERDIFERQRRDRGVAANAEQYGEQAYAPTVTGQMQGIEQRGVAFDNAQEDRTRDMRSQAMRNALALSARMGQNGVPPAQQAERAGRYLSDLGYDEQTVGRATQAISTGEMAADEALSALFQEEQAQPQYSNPMEVDVGGQRAYVREVVQPDGSRGFVDMQGNPVDNFAPTRAQPRASRGPETWMPLDPNSERAQALGVTRPGYQVSSRGNVREVIADGDGGGGQVAAGKERLDATVREAANLYARLDAQGGVPSEQRGAGSNAMNALARGIPGADTVLGALGDENANIALRVGALQADLLNGIRQATGMSARAMDSDRELQFYLQTATQPQRDIMANYGALYAIDRRYGLGGAVESVIPPEDFEEVQRRAATLIEEAPQGAGRQGGATLIEEAPQGAGRQGGGQQDAQQPLGTPIERAEALGYTMTQVRQAAQEEGLTMDEVIAELEELEELQGLQGFQGG